MPIRYGQPMWIDFSELSANRIYYILTQTLIPRPVAWVLSDNGDHSLNLAPFSAFMLVTSDPPILAVSVGNRQPGTPKDTRLNIEQRDYFVVHIAHTELASHVSATSQSAPKGKSELEETGLNTTPIANFPLPRIEACRIAFACRKHSVLDVGNAPHGLVLGEILGVHIDDAVASERDGRLYVDARAVDPVTALGFGHYATFGDVISIPRPK